MRSCKRMALVECKWGASCSNTFTEAQLEAAIIELLGEAGYPHVPGATLARQPQKERATVAGKAMFVSSNRHIAYNFYKEVIALRPEWAEVKVCADGVELTEQEKKQIMPMERIKLVMTRGQDDEPALYEILGTKDYRKELDRQFKTAKSNFKIAIVVDMWLTGFDVPFLDSMYIDKPVKRHNLIQTISRVNRKYQQKEKGLIID